MTTILLTVPHAVCASEQKPGSHSCDFVAIPFASGIQAALARASPEVIVKVLPAEVTRSILDVNRPWTRSSDWRQAVRDLRPECHVDVHSYYESYPGFKGMDVVVMCRRRPTKRSAGLVGDLAAAGFRTGLVVSPGMVDITSELEDLGIPSWIIEVSEGLAPSALDAIAEVVARGVLSCANATNDAYLPHSQPCHSVHNNVLCYFVDHTAPSGRLPLWFPMTSPVAGRSGQDRSVLCAYCRSPVNLRSYKVCGACATVAYCSEEHQKADWESSDHRHWLICALIAMPPKVQAQNVELSEEINVGCRRGHRHEPLEGSHSTFHCSVCGEVCSAVGDDISWQKHAQRCYENNIGRPV